MRAPFLLLCLSLVAAGAAEREAITLADGRTLVGVYDEAAGTIALDGKVAAIVKVDPASVKERGAAPAVVAVAPRPKPVEPKPAASALPFPRAAFAAELADHQRRTIAMFLAWADALELKLVPHTEPQKDARPSEVSAWRQAESANSFATAIRELRMSLHREESPQSLRDGYDRIVLLLQQQGSESSWASYVAHGGK